MIGLLGKVTECALILVVVEGEGVVEDGGSFKADGGVEVELAEAGVVELGQLLGLDLWDWLALRFA